MAGKRPVAILLPGLDGTGRFSTNMAQALATWFEPVIVSYPSERPVDYDELAAEIAADLPRDDFIVVAESFAGPIALKLALYSPKNLRSVVLGASFARLDLPFKSAMAHSAQMFPPKLIPAWLVSRILLGRWHTAKWSSQVKEILASVDPQVLKFRMREALSVDLLAASALIDVPILYLQATQDLVVPASAGSALAEVVSRFELKDVDAPHFLFQVRPRECAELIAGFHSRIAN